MSDAARTRTVTWDDPVLHAWRASSGDGLDILARVVAGELPQSPMALLMGFALVEAGKIQAAYRKSAKASATAMGYALMCWKWIRVASKG